MFAYWTLLKKTKTILSLRATQAPTVVTLRATLAPTYAVRTADIARCLSLAGHNASAYPASRAYSVKIRSALAKMEVCVWKACTNLTHSFVTAGPATAVSIASSEPGPRPALMRSVQSAVVTMCVTQSVKTWSATGTEETAHCAGPAHGKTARHQSCARSFFKTAAATLNVTTLTASLTVLSARRPRPRPAHASTYQRHALSLKRSTLNVLIFYNFNNC